MTCAACALAMDDPTRDGGEAQCDNCKARAIAALCGFTQEAMTDDFTAAYRLTLERLFGARWRLSHSDVKAWTKRIIAARAQRQAAEVKR